MGYATSEAAEEAFYLAFRQADLDAMREIWAGHDSVSCVHPQAEPLLGQQAVMQSWLDIFDGSTGVGIVAEPLASSVGANLAVHLVTEKLLDAEGRVNGVIVATNVYELTDDGWKMLLHHASPQPGAAVDGLPATHQLH